MTDKISGDAAKYAQNKRFIEDLFKTITDSALPAIIKHFKKVEEKLKKDDSKQTLSEVLNNCKDGKEKSVIHFAAARGDVKILDHLIKEGADPEQKDVDGNNAFFTAISHYHLEMVRYFIEDKKVDVNQKRNDDQIPLHIACNIGDVKISEYLIKQGADVNATSVYGKPINWAVAVQQIPVVKLLLENKADPNGDNTKQIPPPLILAADFGHDELFTMLIDAGADINITFDAYNVLHVAAEKGHIEMVKQLVAKGANAELEAHGVTPIELAKKEGQFEVVAWLRQNTKNEVRECVEKEIEAQNKRKEEEEKIKALGEQQKEAQAKITEENKKTALERKELGNQHFQKEEFEESLKYYNEAIQADPSSVVYYSNKAAALIKLNKFQDAVDTCQLARNQEGVFTKIFFREGQAYQELKMFGDAAASYWEAMRIEPDNKLYKSLFDRAIALGKKHNKGL